MSTAGEITGSVGALLVPATVMVSVPVADVVPSETTYAVTTVPLKSEHITRLADDESPDWPRGRGWKVTVEGSPSMVLESRIATRGEDETDQGCLGTAMHAVHAIAPVCAAAAGIRTFLDLPTIVGRGVLG